jgi:hypothetical protein
MMHRVRALEMNETWSKACKSSPVIPERISHDHFVRYRNHHNARFGSSAPPPRDSSTSLDATSLQSLSLAPRYSSYSELEYALGPPSSSSSAATSSSFTSVSTSAPSLQSSATRPPSSAFPSTLSSNLADSSQISTSEFRTNVQQNSSPTLFSGTASSSSLPQPPPLAGAPRESILVEYSVANQRNPTSRMGGTPLVASRGAFPPSSSSELPGYIQRLMSASMVNEYEGEPTRLPRTSSPSSPPPSLSDPMSPSRPNTLSPPSSWSIPFSTSTTLPAPSSPSSELAGYIRRVMFGFMPNEYEAPPLTRFHETSTSTASLPSLPQPPPSHSGAPWQSAPADHPAADQENRMPWVGDGPPRLVASNGVFSPSSSKLVSDIPVSASGFAANGYQTYSQSGSSRTSSLSSPPPPSLSNHIFSSWPNVLSPSSMSNTPFVSSSALPIVSNVSSGAIPPSSSSELAGDTQTSTAEFATDIYHDSPTRFPGTSSSSWPPPPLLPLAGAPWEPALMDCSAENQRDPTSWVGGDPSASSGAFPPLTSFEPAGHTQISASGFMANRYQASPPWLPETTPTTSSLVADQPFVRGVTPVHCRQHSDGPRRGADTRYRLGGRRRVPGEGVQERF